MTIGKLVKIDREYTVTICDNGYTLSINGRDVEDNWSSAKLIAHDMASLIAFMEEIDNTPLQD